MSKNLKVHLHPGPTGWTLDDLTCPATYSGYGGYETTRILVEVTCKHCIKTINKKALTQDKYDEALALVYTCA